MKNKTVLRIDGELTIFRAAELKPVLLAKPAATEIDLCGVTEIDIAGVQLLMLARKTALADKRPFGLVAHSAPVLEVFELLNLAGYFDEPTVVSSRARKGRKSSPAKKRGSNES